MTTHRRVLMKTLKYEEVYREEYRDVVEAYASIQQFFEQVYNEKRLHSALDYRPPAEFESTPTATKTKRSGLPVVAAITGVPNEFLRHGEIYRPIQKREQPTDDRFIGTMSFRLAIPWRATLPQSSPPLHHPVPIMRETLWAVQSKCSQQQTTSYLRVSLKGTTSLRLK